MLRWIIRALCLANILFLGLVIKFFTNFAGDIGALSSRSDGYLRFLQLIGLMGALGAFVAIYYDVRSWRSTALWVWAKVWNTLLAIAFVGFALFVLNWHMLTTSLRY
jgi:hypothetical protein